MNRRIRVGVPHEAKGTAERRVHLHGYVANPKQDRGRSSPFGCTQTCRTREGFAGRRASTFTARGLLL
jgi:hypothetical protein